MNRRVGYRSMAMASRSSTANAKRRAEIVFASHRFRRTATVSTSTRSGAEIWPADRSSARARRPSEPSSATTFASTDASRTINDAPAARRRRRQLGANRPSHPGVGRSDRGLRRGSACLRVASVPQRGTAAAIAHVVQLASGARRGRLQGDLAPGRWACLHDAITPRSAQVLSSRISSDMTEIRDQFVTKAALRRHLQALDQRFRA